MLELGLTQSVINGEQKMKYNWILASGSPRRKELLRKVLKEFTVEVSECEEVYVSKHPSDIVEELAILKGREVASRHGIGDIIVSADTVVSIDDKILGKPKNYNEAFDMLRSLSGRKHTVYTGVCVTAKFGEEEHMDAFSVATEIYVDELSEEEIASYINEEEPYDKAGSYAIQGSFSKHIFRINGDYDNVVGFPINAFYSLIKKKGYI